MVGLHALEPFVDQRRLAGAALGDQREDVGVAIGPRLIEALQLGVAADEALVAGLGQAGYVDKRRTRGRYDLLPDFIGRSRDVIGAIVISIFGEWICGPLDHLS